MQTLPPIAVVGTGRMATVLCRWIVEKQLDLDMVVSRDPARARRLRRRFGARHAASLEAWNGPARLVLLAVPDDAIHATAQLLAACRPDWRQTVVLHTSGAHTRAPLQPLAEGGAATGSLHPLMTFPRNATVAPGGLVFGLEGEARALRVARRLVRAWGGRPVSLRPEQKTAWHLAAALACPMAVIPFAASLAVLRSAGLEEQQLRHASAGLVQLLRQTAQNLAGGAEAAWTGPLARGDAGTVGAHLSTLDNLHFPELAAAYRAAAVAALTLLPSADAAALRLLLSGPPAHP